MSAREAIFADVRRALAVTGREAPRRRAVEDRLAHAPSGVIPARGRGDLEDRIILFCDEAERVSASVAKVDSHDEVPAAIAAYLHARNLPATVRLGTDPRLAAMAWAHVDLEILHGRAQASDCTGVSHAFGAIAETGSLVLVSGPNNPTTLNFLPETHIVVLDAQDIVADFEATWQKLRAVYGKGVMPRALNIITGPSRSADIAHTLLLGAHGPRTVHVVLVMGETDRHAWT